MSRARSLSRLANANALTVNTDLNVGIGSTSPEVKLDVDGQATISGVTTFSSRVDVGTAATIFADGNAIVGVLTASEFYGDGSNLEGVASAGLGTALGEANGLDVIYYTDKVLTITDTVTVDPPASTNVAYTQYSEIAVADTKDLIVADGDDLIPDVLGLSTAGITPLAGAGGRVRADLFTNKAGTGAPTFQTGLNVTGNLAATGHVSGATGEFTGNVSVGGTLTYEDVTNVDSVGLITARSGIDDKSGGLTFDAWLYS